MKEAERVKESINIFPLLFVGKLIFNIINVVKCKQNDDAFWTERMKKQNLFI